MIKDTTWEEMKLLFRKIQFAKDIESKLVEEGRIQEADEIAFYTDCFYPWDVVKEILDDGEGHVYNGIPPVAAKKPDYYFKNPYDGVVDVGVSGRKKGNEPSPYAFTLVAQDESIEKINSMLAFLKEKGYVFEEEKVMATNVKQITIDIAAPADWDGEKVVQEILERHGLYVLGTNQEDLTEEYQKQGGFGLLEKDGTYGEFSLKEHIEENRFIGTIKVPGVAIVNSEGYQSGNESQVQLYSSIQECIDLSYETYLKTWDNLVQNDDLELEGNRYVDSNGNSCLSKEDYETELMRDGYVLIQLDGFHIQFEYFEREVELNKDLLLSKEVIEEEMESDLSEVSGKESLDARIQESRKILNSAGQTKATGRVLDYEK